MILGIYAIKDTKVAFHAPFYSHSDATAIRDVQTAVNDIQASYVKQHIDDNELWKIGTFDDVTGIVTSDVQFLVSCHDLKKVVE